METIRSPARSTSFVRAGFVENQDNSESGQRDLLRLAVNPKNPEEAIWRPDLQLPRAAKKYMNLRNTLIIGSAVAVVLLLFSAVFERKITHES
jgi:hypothetical protein